jgi:hypothetical protein
VRNRSRIKKNIFTSGHLKGTVSRDFLPLFFFFKLFLLGPVDMPSNGFDFFRLFADIFDYFSASPASTTPAKHALPVSLTPVSNSSPVSMTPVSDTFTILESFTSVNDTGKKLLTGVIDTGEACICRCQWHPTMPNDTSVNDTGVNDTQQHRCQRHRRCISYRRRWHRWRHASPVSLIPGSKDRQLCRCQWQWRCMHCRCHWHRWCTSRTFGSSPTPLEEQSVKKQEQAINRYYFSIVSIQSSKESSNYNKIVCFAGVVDTGKAPEKSNISANIKKKSKSLLVMSNGTRRSCLKKKNQRWKILWHCPFKLYLFKVLGVIYALHHLD